MINFRTRHSGLFIHGSLSHAEKILFWVILAAGCLIRLWRLGGTPSGMHQDEAYAAYEAFCLLRDGRDSWGYAWPVYFVSWGSGMNVMESLLMIPFIALFGLQSWAVRLPQAVLACLALPAFYTLLSILWDRRTGLTGMAVLAVSPWHILLARWGMESNLAPEFLLFGFTLFLLSLEKPLLLLPAVLCVSMALYSYALTWIIVPPVILLLLLWIWHARGLPRFRPLYVFAGVLQFLFALPLFLFLLVNFGVIPEIRTPFFSVPRLLCLRASEISLYGFAENFKNVLRMLVFQNDGETFNAAGPFGIFYFLSVPFFLIGFACMLRDAFAGFKKREPDGSVPVLFIFFVCFMVGCLTDGDIIRINTLMLPVAAVIARGIRFAFSRLETRLSAGRALIAGGYAVLFLCFANYYFTDYAEALKTPYQDGLPQALARAKELAGEDAIHVSGDIEYPRVLFYDRTDPEAFRETFRYEEDGDAFIQPVSFTGFVYDLEEQTPDSGVLLLSPYDAQEDYPGYTFETFGVITVARKS